MLALWKLSNFLPAVKRYRRLILIKQIQWYSYAATKQILVAKIIRTLGTHGSIEFLSGHIANKSLAIAVEISSVAHVDIHTDCTIQARYIRRFFFFSFNISFHGPFNSLLRFIRYTYVYFITIIWNKICEESADQPVTLKRSKYSQRANQLWKQTEYLTGGNAVFIQLLMLVSLAFNAHLGFPSANWDLHENSLSFSL